MFSWLQAKLKHCRLLSRAIDKIKDSSPLSSKRTVNWLWAQLVELLDELREEAKEESITQSGVHCCGPWQKAHLHRRKESNRKQHQHRPPAPPDGPLERVEQKGKGDKDKDKGKGKGDARLTEKAKVQRPKAKLCQRKTHPKRHVFSFRKANGAAATAKSSAAAVALMLPTTARGISVDGPPTPSTTTFWKRSGLSNLFRTVIGWFSVCSHALPAVLPSVSFFYHANRSVPCRLDCRQRHWPELDITQGLYRNRVSRRKSGRMLRVLGRFPLPQGMGSILQTRC